MALPYTRRFFRKKGWSGNQTMYGITEYGLTRRTGGGLASFL